MSITEQAKVIRDSLHGWAQTEGGKALIAFDPHHMWEMWQMNVKAPRIIICYNGEDVRGEFGTAAILGRVDRHWTALVTRGRELKAQRGDTLIESGSGVPFYDLVEQARDLIRALQLDPAWTERPVDFRSVHPFQAGQVFADAYQIEFSIGTQLKKVGERPSTIDPETII